MGTKRDKVTVGGDRGHGPGGHKLEEVRAQSVKNALIVLYVILNRKVKF